MPANTVSPERMALAAQCIEDGWPFSEIMRTHHFDFKTLARHFPGKAWTHKQVSQHGHMAMLQVRKGAKNA